MIKRQNPYRFIRLLITVSIAATMMASPLSAAPNNDGIASSLEDLFVSALLDPPDKLRPWEAKISTMLGYNDNVIKSDNTPPLAEEISRQGGFFGTLSASAKVHFLKSKASKMTAGGRILSKIYGASHADAQLTQVNLFGEFASQLTDRGLGKFKITNDYHHIGGGNFSNQLSFQPGYEYQLTPFVIFSFFYMFAAQEYFGPVDGSSSYTPPYTPPPSSGGGSVGLLSSRSFLFGDSNPQRPTDRDGHLHIARVNVLYKIPKTNLKGRSGVFFYEQHAGNNFDHTAWGLETGFFYELTEKTKLAAYYQHIFDHYDSSISSSGATREDGIDIMTSEFAYAMDIIPETETYLFLRHRFTRSNSTDRAFTYNQHIVGMGAELRLK